MDMNSCDISFRLYQNDTHTNTQPDENYANSIVKVLKKRTHTQRNTIKTRERVR